MLSYRFAVPVCRQASGRYRRAAAACLAAVALAALVSPAPAYPQGAPTAASLAPWTPRDGDRLVFDVFRNGSPFGSHTVQFSRSGDELTVETDIELKVMIGPFTAFHYVHDAVERWKAGRVVSVEARTKNEGKWKALRAERMGDALKVEGAGFTGRIDGDIIPSSHWNAAQMMQRAMFSTETGEMLPMSVTDRGVETVRTANGAVKARRFDVDSDVDASFWYDSAGRWVKCAFVAQGSKVEYVLRDGAAS